MRTRHHNLVPDGTPWDCPRAHDTSWWGHAHKPTRLVEKRAHRAKKPTASLQLSGRVADSTVGGRGCEHGLLDQAGEAVADALGGAPVGAGDVLVQVPLQVLRADGAVMGAEQPALGEGEHEVDRRQPERRVTPGPGEVDRLVAVALGGEAVVAAPAVGRDLGRAADVAAEEALEARGRGVGHRLQAQPAEPPSLALAAPA